MAWPLSQDYNEAIQDPQACFSDPELRAGEAVANALGMPMPRSGNFADVYEFNTPATKSKWAIKCFTRHVSGLRERYTEISAGLLAAKLPFAVEFQYIVQGIRVRGDWFPILKMRWVEGLLLNELVRDNLDKPAVLAQLGIIWGRMAKRLREANIAHADLQHGNVILVPGSKAGSLAVKLIDYDGMFVPALARKKSGEVGHPNYQHPERLRDGTYSAEVDRFPLLVVTTALHALAAGGRQLWDRYDNSDNLLFKEADFQAPGKSPLFADLRKLADPKTRMLVEALQKSLEGKLENVPAVDELLPEVKPTATRAGEPAKSTSVPTATLAAATEAASLDFSDPDSPVLKRKTATKKDGVPPWIWLAGGGALLALILLIGGVAGIAMLFLGGDRGKDKDGPQAKGKQIDDVIPAKDGKAPRDADVKPPKKEIKDDRTTKPPEPNPKDDGNKIEPKKVDPPQKLVPGVFSSIFNGKDTSGWTRKGEGTWKVEPGGVLVGTGPDATLISDRRDLKNDTFRAELSASDDAEIFVGLRVQEDAEGGWKGVSTRIFNEGNSVLAGQAGPIFSTSERSKKRLSFKPGENFVLEARVVASVVLIRINKEVTAIFPLASPPTGAIGIFVKSGSVRINRFELRPAYQIENAIEGETMRVLGKSGNMQESRLPVGEYHTGSWSGDAQLNLVTDRANEWIDLQLPVAAPGRYSVTAYMTKTRDYGIVQFFLDGKPLAEPIDLYATPPTQSMSSGPIELGTVDLTKTSAVLRIKVIGTNEKSIGRRYQTGLDCIVLKPADVAKKNVPEPDGFVPLFNGADLAGWSIAPSGAPDWRVEDGVLIGAAKKGKTSICTVRNDFKDVHLRMEVKYHMQQLKEVEQQSTTIYS